ncbi:MAG TPA: SAM-dependent chlorinase/fluorinase [Gammaproteobacteria bacterium]|nr:SAM-dependent chlorinase/fluorinase [Gammaproteobacteria bacterium]
MILTFTDFGREGPYLGQLELVLHRLAPNVPVVHLMADAPRFRPRSAAYLLAALAHDAPDGTVFLCVVDPDVGARDPVIVRAGAYWFVGPDNGLLEIVAARADNPVWWQIDWRPEARNLSAGFHGRDLYAPVAARLALGQAPEAAGGVAVERVPVDWPPDLSEIIYIDGFGNAATGIRGSRLATAATLAVGGHRLAKAASYRAVAPREPFWYVNSDGLVEIAAGRASAAQTLGLHVGDATVLQGD